MSDTKQEQSPIERVSTILWKERYRPKTLQDIMLPQSVRAAIAGATQDYLFVGPAGTGKTSLARIIAKDRDLLFKNVSLEKTIDVVRTAIQEFGRMRALRGDGIKIIILDEVDGLKPDAQDALRGVIEEYSETCRFILTCNHPERVRQALVSRCKVINFAFNKPEQEVEMMRQYATRIISIANENGMTFENSKVISHMLTTYYPDFRKIVDSMQYIHSTGKMLITANDIDVSIGGEYSALYEQLVQSPNPLNLYTTCSQYRGKEYYVLQSMQTDLVQWVLKNHPNKVSALGDIAIVAHQYGYEVQHSMDSFVTLLACSYKVAIALQNAK